MKQAIPPMLAIALTCLWLLLNDTLEPAHIVLGGVLAVLFTLGIAQMRPLQPKVRRLPLAIKLIFVVLIDIVRSNIAVGRVILGLVRDHEVKPGFLDIPMQLRDPHGLAVLSMIVTSTPGTVWVALSPDGGTLRLHVLDLQDEAGWIRLIKQRYERPLLEIFE
ncbi:MAG TPA: Na+/H+ antiporter subunit E [Povalibacter sp.]|nr:Na+/H+ antiporter subunit E [Povalibacter sp.]